MPQPTDHLKQKYLTASIKGPGRRAAGLPGRLPQDGQDGCKKAPKGGQLEALGVNVWAIWGHLVNSSKLALSVLGHSPFLFFRRLLTDPL